MARKSNISGGNELVFGARAGARQKLAAWLGQGMLWLVASVAAMAVLFIFFFIARDAVPFFRSRGLAEFFGVAAWYPTHVPPRFGALPIFVGSGLVTLGAAIVATPVGILAAVCLSDILPFRLRQLIKPALEILAAIPSVAYGFFALVVFAPLLQNSGGRVLAVAWWILAAPALLALVWVLADMLSAERKERIGKIRLQPLIALLLAPLAGWALWAGGRWLAGLVIISGTNALNASVILGVMALPTVVSVSEDALQAVGRELREGSYALGATRAETVCRAILPAAGSGILAAVLLGVMRALGETMVVWMASGNAAQIPRPWFNYLAPVRTLTATIAGDMGEADHVTGSDRYHVLFAMGLCLLIFCFGCNILAEWFVARQRRRMRGQ